MQNHFRHLCFKSFSMVYETLQSNDFCRFKSFIENSRVHQDFNSQSGSPFPKMGIHLGMRGLIPSHFFTLLGVWMWFPGCTFSPHLSMPCFNHEFKIRVMTFSNLSIIFPSFSTTLCTQLGLPQFSIADIFQCVCTHSINLIGIHLLHYVHGNECVKTHDVIHDTFATIAQDVGFHMG
jgi:hypothetical protein